jgi:hypothetical protein
VTAQKSEEGRSTLPSARPLNPPPPPFTVKNYILTMYFDPKTLSGDFPVDLFPAFVEAELPQIGYTYLCSYR